MIFKPADTILQAAVILYFASMAGYLLFLFNQKKIFQKAAFSFISLACICHLISILIYTVKTGHLPVQNLAQSISIAAFFLACTFIFIQYKFGIRILGVFVSVLIAGSMLAAVLLPETAAENNTAIRGFWLYSHIILVFTGEACLTLACGLAGLYLLQERGIKSKTRGFFFERLPSLDLLDNVAYTCLSTGFALLTVGLIAGFIYAKSIWGRFWDWDPKEVFSVATWIIYAAILHLRLYAGWHGRRSAIMTIIGFFIIVFTFLGVNLLLGGHHQAFTQ